MHPYHSLVSASAHGTTIDYLDTKNRASQKNVRVKYIAMCNETHDTSVSQEIGIIIGTKRIPIYESGEAGSTGICVSLKTDILLGSDDNIYAGFNLATAKDDLWLLVLGEIGE